MPSLRQSLAFGGTKTTRRGAVKITVKYKSDPRLAIRAERFVTNSTLRQAQYIRKVAKNSIRPVSLNTRKASKPGKPPKSRTGALKQNIRYDHDQRRRVAHIGPTRLNKKVKRQPNTLEFGGSSTIDAVRPLNERGKTRRPFRFKKKERYKGRARIRKRPTMALALEKSIPRFTKQFKGRL